MRCDQVSFVRLRVAISTSHWRRKSSWSGGEAVAEAIVEAAGALAALGEQCLALVGELHRLDAAVVRADRAAQAAIPLEVGDDQTDRLRGEHGQAGDLGPGDARVGVDHGHDQELRIGHAEVLERAVDAEADGIAGLAEQVAKVALLAALALTRLRELWLKDCAPS